MQQQLLALIMVCAGLALTAGCSQEYILQDQEGNILGSPKQKYSIFSVLFDGVPDPEKEALQEQLREQQGRKTIAPLDTLQRSEHGPYAAKMCEGCHERGTNRLLKPVEELCLNCHSFNTKDKKVVHGPLAAGACTACHDPHNSPYQFLLIADSKEFCLNCHNRNAIAKSETHSRTNKQCVECHDAHMSDKAFLLK